jgi:hypothetical protein
LIMNGHESLHGLAPDLGGVGGGALPRVFSLRDIGHDLAIDDSGTGYSSLPSSNAFP